MIIDNDLYIIEYRVYFEETSLEGKKATNYILIKLLTLMHVQSENGNVMIKRRPAKHVRTNAQNPGPSGSAENKIQKKEFYNLGLIMIPHNYQGGIVL